MTRKTPESLIDDAQALVSSGASLVEAGKALGVKADIISKRLRERGVVIIAGGRPAPNRRKDLPERTMVEAYRSGESELALSLRFGCNRFTVTRILDRNGVERRTRSQANVRRMQDMSSDARRCLIEAARAIRFANMRKAAYDPTSTHYSIGPGEREIADRLERLGYSVSRQEMIGPYCIDMVVRNLAVEVKQKTRLTFSPYSDIERSKYILERGLSLVFVVFDTAKTVALALDDVIACLEILCREPPPCSEYRVIWSKLAPATLRLNDDKRAFIPVPPKIMTTVRQGNFSQTRKAVG